MPIDKDLQKEALKEALSEWLDHKFAQFGKWSLAGLAAMFMAGVVWIFLGSHGYTP